MAKSMREFHNFMIDDFSAATEGDKVLISEARIRKTLKTSCRHDIGKCHSPTPKYYRCPILMSALFSPKNYLSPIFMRGWMKRAARIDKKRKSM